MREGMARLKQAAAGKADCVPVYAQMSHHAARLAGESTHRFFTDAETFLHCELHAGDFYHFDAPTIHYDCYNIEAEALGAPFIWYEDDFPEVDPNHSLLRSPDDLHRLGPVKIGRAGRMPYVLEINRRLMDLGVAAKIRFCGPITLAAKLMGFENLMMAIVTNPASVHRLFT